MRDRDFSTQRTGLLAHPAPLFELLVVGFTALYAAVVLTIGGSLLVRRDA